MKGYVPIHRKLFRREHWLAPSKRDPACRMAAWIDLIQLAQHDTFHHASFDLKRGEFVASVRWLADRWGWSKSAVSRFLGRLASDTMIGTVRETPRGTVYHLVGYDDYAVGRDTTRDTERDTERDTSGTRAGQEQEQTTNNKQTTSDFEAVWSLSRRGSKKKALDQYRKAEKKADHATILSARSAHVTAAREPQYIQHLERWLRDERWNDVEVVTAPAFGGPPQPMRLRIPVRD